MPLDDAAGPADGDQRPADALIPEIRAAADAAAAQVRKVAATASAEARLTVVSAVAMASATMLIVALLIAAWTCIVALGVWLAIQAGWPVAAALVAAALVNIAAAAACRFWYTRLARNIGFSRTLDLLFGHGHGRTPDGNPEL